MAHATTSNRHFLVVISSIYKDLFFRLDFGQLLALGAASKTFLTKKEKSIVLAFSIFWGNSFIFTTEVGNFQKVCKASLL